MRLGFCASCREHYDQRRERRVAQRGRLARAFLGQMSRWPLAPELVWELAMLAAICAESDGVTSLDEHECPERERRWVTGAVFALLAEMWEDRAIGVSETGA